MRGGQTSDNLGKKPPRQREQLAQGPKQGMTLMCSKSSQKASADGGNRMTGVVEGDEGGDVRSCQFLGKGPKSPSRPLLGRSPTPNPSLFPEII